MCSQGFCREHYKKRSCLVPVGFSLMYLLCPLHVVGPWQRKLRNLPERMPGSDFIIRNLLSWRQVCLIISGFNPLDDKTDFTILCIFHDVNNDFSNLRVARCPSHEAKKSYIRVGFDNDIRLWGSLPNCFRNSQDLKGINVSGFFFGGSINLLDGCSTCKAEISR